MKRSLEMTENEVVDQITAMLGLNGIRWNRIVERIPVPDKRYRTSTPGIPDLQCWFPAGCHTLQDSTWASISKIMAIHFFLEVKRRNGRLRASQAKWIGEARADGVLVAKVESWDEVREYLEGMGFKLKVRGI